MRKLVTSSLLAGAAAAGAIALTAPAAFAATWTVSGGTSATGTSTSIAFKDTTSGANFTCTSSTVHATLLNGSGLSGTGIGSLSGSFSTCSGPVGSTGSATLNAGSLNAVSFAAPVTKGTITGVSATLHITDILGSCTATVTGAANTVTYNNTTHKLASTADATPALTVASATGSGCAGVIAAGHKATFAATYSVTPNITITSP